MSKTIRTILAILFCLFVFSAVVCQAQGTSSSNPSSSTPTLNFQQILSEKSGGVYSKSFSPYQNAYPYGTPLQTLQNYTKNNVPAQLSNSLSAVNPNLYSLYPGDVLSLQLWTPAYSKIITSVSPLGTIDLGAVGDIPVKGVLLSKLSGYLEKVLKQDYKQIKVEANLTRVRTVKVEILGNVNKPGEYTLPGTAGALNAIGTAGGLTSAGSLRQIEIKKDRRIMKTLDYFKWKMFGAVNQNPYLEPGETIYVPTIRSVAAVGGNVKRPGTYEILSGETYKDLLKMAGGYSAQADISQIKLSRILPHHQEINLSVTPNLALQNGDSVYVPPISLFQTRIKVIGELNGVQSQVSAAPKSKSSVPGIGMGWYYLHKNERVKDVILNLGGFTPLADPSHAWIERKEPDGKKRIIHLNLHKLFADNDESQNIRVKDGDILIVPPSQDSIYVLGDVGHPGVFPYIPGDQVRDYVAMAAGNRLHGVLTNIKVVRMTPGVKKPKIITVNLQAELTGGQKGKNLTLEPGDVIYVPRTQFATLQDIFGLFGNIFLIKELFP